MESAVSSGVSRSRAESGFFDWSQVGVSRFRSESGWSQLFPTGVSLESPGSRKFCLASGGSSLNQNRLWLGLVGFSRIPSGTFFSGDPSWLVNGQPK